MTLLSLWAPLLCTAAAPTWIRVLRVEIKKGRAQPGCCRKPHKGSPKKKQKKKTRGLVPSLDGGICTVKDIHASKTAPGCVHLCMCSVFAKEEGLSTFNYLTAKTLHVHSRASRHTDPDTLLRGSSCKKADQRGSLTKPANQLPKLYFFSS